MKVSSKGSFTPAPEGLHNAVLVDIVDLGWVAGTFGSKEMLRLVWEIDKTMTEGDRKGQPFLVMKRYGKSLHPKSNLHGDLVAWRGQSFTTKELEGFELDVLLGKPCQLLVTHADKDGTVYANIKAIMKPKEKLNPSGSYTRVKDRKTDEKKPDYVTGVDEPKKGEFDPGEVPF